MVKSDVSSLSFKDILGFEPPKGANVFLPHIKCVPITTLLPLYDKLTVGISKIENISQIQDQTGLTLSDIVALAHREKLSLYINVDCLSCLKEMSDVVQQFVDNDVPLIFAGPQETLLALKAAETAGIDVEEGEKIENEYSDLIESPQTKELNEKLNAFAKLLHEKGESLPSDLPLRIRDTTYPMAICSKIKPTAEYLREVIELGRKGAPSDYLKALVGRLHMIPNFLMSKASHSILSTNATCRFLYGIEEDFKKSLRMLKPPDYFDPTKLEFIEKKLHIAYCEDIPLVEYAEIFDSKTTKALRKIINKIISEASQRKMSFFALQNSIDDYNQEVNELISRKTKRAKIVYATSDILRSNVEAIKLLIGGIAEKYLNAPQKAWDCIGLPRRYRRSVSEWLRQKRVWVESKLVGVSPEIIHLYHTRTCLEARVRV